MNVIYTFIRINNKIYFIIRLIYVKDTLCQCKGLAVPGSLLS